MCACCRVSAAPHQILTAAGPPDPPHRFHSQTYAYPQYCTSQDYFFLKFFQWQRWRCGCHPCVFSSPSCVSARRSCCPAVTVHSTVPAATLSSGAAEVKFGPLVVLPLPTTVITRHRLLTRWSDSTREFGVEKMRNRGTLFWYVCVAVHLTRQNLVRGYSRAAKSIVIFQFRDFCRRESSNSWPGFLHRNLWFREVWRDHTGKKKLLTS